MPENKWRSHYKNKIISAEQALKSVRSEDRVVFHTTANEPQALVNAESMGPLEYSGVGGQADFVRGANRSKGGKSIIAFPSTAVNGSVSRIVAALDSGAAVTTPRGDVNYIVTEYGTADLRGKSLRQRAKALISIAHPKFRDILMREAVEMGWI